MPLLQIDIEARYAKFQDALSTIERDTKKTAASLNNAFGSVKATLAGLGAAISVSALVGVVRAAIDAADNLDEMSKRTGVAVEVLGGLGFAAEQSGGSLESIGDVADKLNKSIAGAASGNKQFAEGFAALGIGLKDAEGNLKTVDQVLTEIADKFAQYADGPEKVALAQRLMGKSGAEQIAMLNAGGAALQENIEYYKRYSGVTAQVAEDAGKFNDTLAKVSLLAGGAGQQIAAQLLEPLQNVASAFVDAREKSDAFANIGKVIGTAFEALVILGANVSFTFGAVGREIGGIAAQMDRLAHADFKGFKFIGDQMKKDAAAARAELDAFTDRILNPKPPVAAPSAGPGTPAGTTPPNKPKPRAPTLKTGGGSDDPSLRILDGKLKALERQSQAEQQLLATRSDFLQTYYQDDLLSIGEYYDGLRSAQAEALAAQEANINKEIALLRGRKPKDAREGADRDSKISDLEDRKTALQTAASRDGIKLQLEQDRAAQQFRQTLQDINLELMEQQGLLPQAAAMRFDASKGSVRNKLLTERDAAAASGDTEGVAARDADLDRLDTLRGLTIAQAKLNSLGDVGYRIQADLSEATERAQIAADTGSMGELDSLRAVSDARLQAVSDLQQVATAFDDVARATGDPRMVQEARALQLEVDKLAASADLVRERFEDAFASPFESAIDKLISGTASLKDVFKGLFSDISSELVKMSARDLTKQLFAKEGALGGIVDFTAGMFGGRSKVPTASADVASAITKNLSVGDQTTPALAIQTTAINASSEALNTLTLAAQSAASAMSGAQAPGAVMAPMVPSIDGVQVLAGVADPEVAGATAEASNALLDCSKNAYGASADLARLANAAGIGGGALGQLPSIINLFQMAVATMSTTNSASSSGSGIFGAIAGLFKGADGGGMTYEAAVASTGMFAKGDAFNDGDVIPFAKGGVPSIVSTPTFFPMKGGKTGLMGEAGPEAIMPLARTGAGELAVTMVGEDGKRSLLPVMRDAGGRMAVRAQAQVKAFANGGVFGSGGSLERVAGKAFGVRPGMSAQPVPAGKGGRSLEVHNHFSVSGPTNTASQAQIAAAASRGVARGMRGT